MKEKIVRYNPDKDLAEVSQIGAVNLVEAYNKNVVPADIAETVERFNNIDNPDSILGRPHDVFEAAHMRETVSSYQAPSNNPDGV